MVSPGRRRLHRGCFLLSPIPIARQTIWISLPKLTPAMVPVDFKVASGFTGRVVVEIKLSHQREACERV